MPSLNDPAVVDDQGAVAHAEGLGDVVIGDQHALAELLFQADDLALEVFDGDRIDAAEWLVEQDQLGLGDQRAGDLQLSPLAAAEGVGPLVADLDQAVLVEQLLGPAVALGRGRC